MTTCARIIVSLTLRDPKPEQLLEESEREKKKPEPHVIDRLQFKRDYQGYLDRRRSHLYVLEKITTPTLVMCGALDWNVPVLNSEQLYQALRRLGRTTQLVVYPGEHHGIRKPSFQKDRFQRYLDWYGRHVKGEAPATDAPAHAPADETAEAEGGQGHR